MCLKEFFHGFADVDEELRASGVVGDCGVHHIDPKVTSIPHRKESTCVLRRFRHRKANPDVTSAASQFYLSPRRKVNRGHERVQHGTGPLPHHPHAAPQGTLTVSVNRSSRPQFPPSLLRYREDSASSTRDGREIQTHTAVTIEFTPRVSTTTLFHRARRPTCAGVMLPIPCKRQCVSGQCEPHHCHSIPKRSQHLVVRPEHVEGPARTIKEP